LKLVTALAYKCSAASCTKRLPSCSLCQ
jgi:hypothetical protein